MMMVVVVMMMMMVGLSHYIPGGPFGLQALRLQEFLDSRYMKVERPTLLTGRLYR